MDGSRFDDVARLIGTGASRRGVLKGLAAGLLGIGGTSIARHGVGAQDVCAPVGESCEELACCSVYVCVGSPATCHDPTACTNEGDGCNAATGPICCGGRACVNGICASCIGYGNVCGDGNTCCDGLTCLTGGVDPVCGVSCAGEGEVCVIGGGAACCDGFICNVTDGASGTCIPEGPACVAEGGVCGFPGGIDERNCCDGLVCNSDSYCEVPTVPECEVDADCAPCHACIEGTCSPQCADACQVCDEQSGENGTCRFDCRAGTGNSCCDVDEACNQETGVCDAIDAPACEIDADCVAAASGDAAICCGGVCLPIACCPEDQNPNARCGTGEVCSNGVCTFTCAGDADCASGTCCCGDGACSAGCCETVDDDTPPASSGGVTALPITGTGDRDGNLGGLLGAGLAAAGAAYLTGKRLRVVDNDAVAAGDAD